jgi:hypothetical protein
VEHLYLIDHLNMTHTHILDKLWAKELINWGLYESVYVSQTVTDRVRELLSAATRWELRQYQGFFDILREEQGELFSYLHGKYNELVVSTTKGKANHNVFIVNCSHLCDTCYCEWACTLPTSTRPTKLNVLLN